MGFGFLQEWGSEGTDTGQFDGVADVAVNRAGTSVYVLSDPRAAARVTTLWPWHRQVALRSSVPAEGHRVAVVVAPGFADEVRRIAGERHVWAIRVDEYLRIADDLRAESPHHSLERGVTLFVAGHGGPEDEVLSIFGTVEEHHGEYSHDPPLDEVEVLGASPTAEVRAELGAHGFTEVVQTTGGFVASRDRNPTCEQTYATFRLAGDSLDPEEATAALGLEPTKALRKGQEIPTGRKSIRIQRTGIWMLTSKDDVWSTDLERHLVHLLDVLEPAASALAELRLRRDLEPDFFCFWMSASGHGGPDIAPGTLARIAALDACLGIDFYDASGDSE